MTMCKLASDYDNIPAACTIAAAILMGAHGYTIEVSMVIARQLVYKFREMEESEKGKGE
jgi:hypothetical protein